MPSVFDTLAAIPCRFTQGEAVAWAETLTDYPVASYAVAYNFNAPTTPLDGVQAFAIVGAETLTDTYTFTTPTSVKPGIYNWQKEITKTAGSVKRYVCAGTITVCPSDSVVQTITTEAAQVTALQTVISEFATTSRSSVSFNGQSFSRASIAEYQKSLAYLQARVIAQQRALAALCGCPPVNAIGRIVTRFAPAVDIFTPFQGTR